MELKRKLFQAVLAACALVAMPTTGMAQQEKQPAFPGAEGFGRYVTGGRGGKVYHVSNLNDSGEGSLRWALSQSDNKKIIVFDVAGTIELKSALSIGSNVTIAGQTSPGGICVADYPMSIKGSNVIVRYMRFRLGNDYVTVDGADGWDGFGGFDTSNLMIDHCSVSWSIDECLSVLGNKNTTVQWCLVAQSLVNAGHTKGAHGYGGNWGGDHASFHHNLLAHHTSRTPRLGPRPTTQMSEYMDMRNNVIYNWASNGCYGGEGMDVNIVNNYYKPGPATLTLSSDKQKRIAGIGIRTNSYVKTYPAYAPALHKWGHFYVDGNVNPSHADVTKDNWTYGIYNQISNSSCDNLYTATTKDTMKLRQPLDIISTTTHTAEKAYELVLQYAGASNYRDELDAVMVNDAENGLATYTGSGLSSGFINSQNDLGSNPWPTLSQTYATPTDTDGDGIPDNYEDAHGLDPYDATDGSAVASNGYTNVENYINSLVDAITTAQNADGTVVGNIETTDQAQTATDWELSSLTCSNNKGTGSPYVFNDGFTITNTKGKTYGAGSNGCIKYSKGVQWTINLPAGVSVGSVTVKGYGNHGDTYLAELGGKTFATTDYPFLNGDSRSEADYNEYTITLDQPATSTITFTSGSSAEIVLKFTLHSATTTGITSINDVPAETRANVYATDGRMVLSGATPAQVQRLQKGVYIYNHKTIVVK